VDEVQLHVVPVVAGDGTRLLDGLLAGLRLTKVRVVDARTSRCCATGWTGGPQLPP
jgi:hypothetical protein